MSYTGHALKFLNWLLLKHPAEFNSDLSSYLKQQIAYEKVDYLSLITMSLDMQVYLPNCGQVKKIRDLTPKEILSYLPTKKALTIHIKEIYPNFVQESFIKEYLETAND